MQSQDAGLRRCSKRIVIERFLSCPPLTLDQCPNRSFFVAGARRKFLSLSHLFPIHYSLQNALHSSARNAPRVLFLDAIAALLTEADSQVTVG